MLRSQPRVQEVILLFLGNSVGRTKSQEREAQAHFPAPAFSLLLWSPSSLCKPSGGTLALTVHSTEQRKWNLGAELRERLVLHLTQGFGSLGT